MQSCASARRPNLSAVFAVAGGVLLKSRYSKSLAGVCFAPKSGQVRFVPCVDGSELARVFFTFAGWSVQPCVRPVSAAHRPLAIMPCADQVPVKSPHSTMHWHMWVVLIAGSAGSALRAVRPPNLHITPMGRRDLVQIASATGSL